jgi:hypothetical protein
MEYVCNSNPKLFDGHVHLLGEDKEAYLAALVGALDRNNVARAVVFGVQGDPQCLDLPARNAAEKWPDRLVPFCCDIDPNTAGAARLLDQRLRSETWGGVGELFLATADSLVTYRTRTGQEQQFRYHVPTSLAKGAPFHDVLQVCADHHKPVLLHADDANVLDETLAQHPDLIVIWAHADWQVPDAHRLLTCYPDLYVEIGAHLHFNALRAPDVPIEQAPFMADWLAACLPFIEEYAGRITFGSDAFEWCHLEPPSHADTCYTPVRQICQRLSPAAAKSWLWDTLSNILQPR